MRGVWIPSSDALLAQSQRALLDHFVTTALSHHQAVLPNSGYVINYVDTHGEQHPTHAPKAKLSSRKLPTLPKPDKTIVLMHGFGSGVGFFFNNIEGLSRGGNRVIAADWLGMGGSSRPRCGAAPRMPLISSCTPFSTEQAVRFFVDHLEEWREEMGLEKFVLAGHSLGGYLSACYALKYPQHVEKLVLISPVGVPFPFSDTTDSGAVAPQRQSVPLMLRMIDAAWSANVTPQGIVRAAGWRGPEMVKSMLSRRFGGRWQEHETKLLSDYLYHISVAASSRR